MFNVCKHLRACVSAFRKVFACVVARYYDCFMNVDDCKWFFLVFQGTHAFL
jgi:hypothetical protein